MSINRCATTIATAAASSGLVTVVLDAQNINAAVLIFGALTAAIACMVLCTAWLVDVIKTQHLLTVAEVRKAARPTDEAYDLGFEMGQSKGWNDACDEIRAAQPRMHKLGLVAVDGHAVSNN